MMLLFLLIFEILQCIQYIHPSPFAVVPLHLLIAGQLSRKNLSGVLSRVSNSGLPYSKPTHYQLRYATPFLVTPHPESLKLERVLVETIKNSPHEEQAACTMCTETTDLTL